MSGGSFKRMKEDVASMSTSRIQEPSIQRIDGYFDDFKVGMVWRHKRGKTMGQLEVAFMAQLMMNSAQGHFNDEAPEVARFGRKIAFGGFTAALVIGLAAQDTASHAVEELEVRSLKLLTPVFEGDSLYAASEVLDLQADDGTRTGVATFRHYGFNQREEQVCDIVRSVRLRLREEAA
ncbi:MAG: MaoC family dehydratase [Pigmentiphaga sp.]